MKESVRIPLEDVTLDGDLDVPSTASALVVFAHGTGSSRLSPRNTAVAEYLRRSGRFGTLLFDLLTEHEDAVYANRFDIELLTARLAATTRWVRSQPCCQQLPVAFFGASTGAAAALRAAVELPDVVEAVVSRGGRPDLAEDALEKVEVPVLLIVGGADTMVLELNESAGLRIPGGARIEIVPGATHLFEERGALQRVADLTLEYLEEQFASRPGH